MQQTMRLPRRCYRCMSHRLPALMQQCYVMASRRAHTSVTRTACCIGCRAVSHAAPIAHRLPSTCPLHLVKARCIGCRLTRRTHCASAAVDMPAASSQSTLHRLPSHTPHPFPAQRLRALASHAPTGTFATEYAHAAPEARRARAGGGARCYFAQKKNQRREGRGRRSRATRRKRRNQRARRSLRSTSCQRVLMQGEAS